MPTPSRASTRASPPHWQAAAPARRRASNFLVAAPSRSATRNSLAVMGPQLGYYYPEIVQQIDLHGPGINAQGAAVPGLAMYILIGRTQDYAWSLTSAGHDVRDVYAEQLCETDGSAPTRASADYLFNGQCNPMDTFNAGTLGSTPLIYHVTVHGPVFATATVGGQAVRPLAPALDVRSRRPQPRCAEGHDRGQGGQVRRASTAPRTSSGSPSTGPTSRARRPPTSPPRIFPSVRAGSIGACRRSAPGSTSGSASSHRRSTRTTPAVPEACCSTGTTARRPASCTVTTSPTARCSGWRCSTAGRRRRRSPTTSAS